MSRRLVHCKFFFFLKKGLIRSCIAATSSTGLYVIQFKVNNLNFLNKSKTNKLSWITKYKPTLKKKKKFELKS